MKIKDLTGQRFGKLIVTGFAYSKNGSFWNCKCDCGNEVIISTSHLNGGQRSCGKCEDGRYKDLKGQRFGRLIVLERISSTRWRCLCDCGKYATPLTNQLTTGNVKSCGCYHDSILKEFNTTHGESKTRLYKIWKGMHRRCKTPSCVGFRFYGGRGIKVCPEWDDFTVFRDWSYKHGYVDGLTIDRIDIDGDYCPENCRWITMGMQANNKSNNHWITINGEKHTIAEWARIKGIPSDLIRGRLYNGWDEERAVMTPAKKINKFLLKEMPVISEP